ncbi:MAG: sensor histidine kinase [Actinomycetota bacterium]
MRDLLASRALFKGIVDIAADAIISTDAGQRIVLFNQGAERIFGWRADEVLGKPLAILLPEDARSGHARHVIMFGSQDTGARQMGERGQIRGRRKDGTIFPAEASISRIEVDGRTTYTAILRDVTLQREYEAAIERLNADLKHRAALLETANRELEAFSYSVSHDLRAPLRSIDGFSQVLIEDYADTLPPDGRSVLDRVRSATQRMGQLIDDILNLSRLTRGEVRRQPVDLSAMARQIADELAKAEPGRQVSVDIADGIEAHADPHLIYAALSNLLGNAWKYTSRHSTAAIAFGATDLPDGRRAFFVKDDGAGFDMAYVHKLFGAFQRLHGMNDYPGTGIGLATVQRIVHKHGGEVWAEGAIERGATFTFTLG